MAEQKLSKFFTVWFYLDAAMNAGCAAVYYFAPRLFFEGIGGPYGNEVTPNMEWAVRTQATYFGIASASMVTGGLSQCATTRRRLAMAFMIPGVMMWAPSIAIRANQDGGWSKTWIAQMISVVVVTAPYVWYSFVRPEDRNVNGSQNLQAVDDESRALFVVRR